VTNPSSPLYNKGRPWILGSHPTIAREFAQQSMLDLDNFLDSRAAEMAPGGILFAYFVSRQDPGFSYWISFTSVHCLTPNQVHHNWWLLPKLINEVC
jgi:hypothetical protein